MRDRDARRRPSRPTPAVTPGTTRNGDARGAEVLGLLGPPAEDERVAPLEPDHPPALPGVLDQQVVDLVLRQRAMADRLARADPQRPTAGPGRAGEGWPGGRRRPRRPAPGPPRRAGSAGRDRPARPPPDRRSPPRSLIRRIAARRSGADRDQPASRLGLRVLLPADQQDAQLVEDDHRHGEHALAERRPGPASAPRRRSTMIRMANFRFARKSSAVKMPIRSRKSMISGVWKQTPKTSGRIVAKLIQSASRRVGSIPSQTLNSSRKLSVIGRTPKKQRKTPDEEQAERERQELRHVVPLVAIEPGRDERPDLVEDPGAGDAPGRRPGRP